MAWARILRIILVLLLSAPEQRQNRTRSGPKSLWMKLHRLQPKIPGMVKGHTIPLSGDEVNVQYNMYSILAFSIPYVAEFMNRSSESSAALLIVCEHNFYCLVQTILVRTKSG